MSCIRCGYQYCWCCMGPYGENHQKWYRLCPQLPFSFCGNTIFTLVFILFLPLWLILANILFILRFTMYEFPKKCAYRMRIE